MSSLETSADKLLEHKAIQGTNYEHLQQKLGEHEKNLNEMTMRLKLRISEMRRHMQDKRKVSSKLNELDDRLDGTKVQLSAVLMSINTDEQKLSSLRGLIEQCGASWSGYPYQIATLMAVLRERCTLKQKIGAFCAVLARGERVLVAMWHLEQLKAVSLHEFAEQKATLTRLGGIVQKELQRITLEQSSITTALAETEARRAVAISSVWMLQRQQLEAEARKGYWTLIQIPESTERSALTQQGITATQHIIHTVIQPRVNSVVEQGTALHSEIEQVEAAALHLTESAKQATLQHFEVMQRREGQKAHLLHRLTEAKEKREQRQRNRADQIHQRNHSVAVARASTTLGRMVLQLATRTQERQSEQAKKRAELEALLKAAEEFLREREKEIQKEFEQWQQRQREEREELEAYELMARRQVDSAALDAFSALHAQEATERKAVKPFSRAPRQKPVEGKTIRDSRSAARKEPGPRQAPTNTSSSCAASTVANPKTADTTGIPVIPPFHYYGDDSDDSDDSDYTAIFRTVNPNETIRFPTPPDFLLRPAVVAPPTPGGAGAGRRQARTTRNHTIRTTAPTNSSLSPPKKRARPQAPLPRRSSLFLSPSPAAVSPGGEDPILQSNPSHPSHHRDGDDGGVGVAALPLTPVGTRVDPNVSPDPKPNSAFLRRANTIAVPRTALFSPSKEPRDLVKRRDNMSALSRAAKIGVPVTHATAMGETGRQRMDPQTESSTRATFATTNSTTIHTGAAAPAAPKKKLQRIPKKSSKKSDTASLRHGEHSQGVVDFSHGAARRSSGVTKVPAGCALTAAMKNINRSTLKLPACTPLQPEEQAGGSRQTLDDFSWETDLK